MCDGTPNSHNRRLGCGFVSHQHLQCSWVWAGISGHVPSHETGPLNRQRPAAPQCCRPFPDSACAFVQLECGWCSALHRGTRTPSPSDHWDQHLEIEHIHKVLHMTNINKLSQIFKLSKTPVDGNQVCVSFRNGGNSADILHRSSLNQPNISIPIWIKTADGAC